MTGIDYKTVETFYDSWHAQVILQVCPLLTSNFIQHHNPISAVSAPYYTTHTPIVSKFIMNVTPSCDLLSLLCTVYAILPWNFAPDLKISCSWFCYGSKTHCDLTSVPEYKAASSIMIKLWATTIFHIFLPWNWYILVIDRLQDSLCNKSSVWLD